MHLLTQASPSERISAWNGLQTLQVFSDLRRSVILKNLMFTHFHCKDTLENAD